MSDLMRRESRFRSPLASVLQDGEKWMVGFDDMFNRLVEKWEDGFDGFHEYPASNIKKVGDDKFRIELAVAGFKKKICQLIFRMKLWSLKANPARRPRKKRVITSSAAFMPEALNSASSWRSMTRF